MKIPELGEVALQGSTAGALLAAQNPAQRAGEDKCMEANAQRENCENADEYAFSATSENDQYAQQGSNL